MQQKQVIAILVAVFVIIGIGYMVIPQQSESEEDQVTAQDTVIEIEELDLAGSESVERGVDEMSEQEVTGVYAQYSTEAVVASTAEHIVLVFSASWCPTCRALDQDIVANEDAIPAGVEIYTVDFDTETELRRTYGVTVQHTLVEIDNTSNEVKKWTGGTTLASVLDQL